MMLLFFKEITEKAMAGAPEIQMATEQTILAV
jgi:hypothetical protein